LILKSLANFSFFQESSMLTSLQNPLVKQFRKLHSAKARREEGLFLLEGTHLLEEASAVNFPLSVVCCTPRWQEKHLSLWDQVSALATRTQLVSDKVLESMATTVQPDGVVAIASRVITQTTPLTSLGLVLETIQDPGNLGTIIRTTASTEAQALWLSRDSVDLDHPKVLRASAGAWFRLPMAVKDNLKEDILECKRQGMQILATVPDASLSYWDVNLANPSLILLGNEGAGLSPELISFATHQVTIPLSRGIESLNVAIAASLILYEAQRQRHITP
jgi:TrmH family RNA methyltransferase